MRGGVPIDVKRRPLVKGASQMPLEGEELWLGEEYKDGDNKQHKTNYNENPEGGMTKRFV